MKIPYVNLEAQWKEDEKELKPILLNILKKGQYIGGDEINEFEKKICKICGTKYAVALNSGTDALTLGLYLLGVKRGDEVITPPNSFISSTSSIVHIGAKPVFVDVLKDQNINPELIERAITKKTKAIMPVHLTGRIAEMNSIIKISKKYKIPIIEDAAQSIGSKYHGKKSGSFGSIGCFSAHPLKNLNGIGDGGFLTTNNFSFYKKAIMLRNHGQSERNIVKHFGYLSRMDTLQAAVLNFRIKKLNKIIVARRENADYYFKNIDENKYLLPREKKFQFNSYHTFVIQTKKRDKIIKYLKKNGIQTAIHYPVPIHLQPASKFLGYKKGSFKKTEEQSKRILTLPINQFLTEREIKYICQKINFFLK